MYRVLNALLATHEREDGDIAGWVLIVLMSAGLVIAVWGIAEVAWWTSFRTHSIQCAEALAVDKRGARFPSVESIFAIVFLILLSLGVAELALDAVRT